MIRALNKDLGGSTRYELCCSVSISVAVILIKVATVYRDRFYVMGTYAVSGHSTFYSGTARAGRGGIWTSVSYWWDHLNLIVRFHVVDYVLAAIQYVRGESTAKIERVGR